MLKGAGGLAIAVLLAINYPSMADAPTGILMAQVSPPLKLAEVLQVTGEVRLKRGGGNGDYRAVRPGETLQLGDLLKVSKGSRGVIRCSFNQSTWTVPDDGQPWGIANVCPTVPSTLR